MTEGLASVRVSFVTAVKRARVLVNESAGDQVPAYLTKLGFCKDPQVLTWHTKAGLLGIQRH